MAKVLHGDAGGNQLNVSVDKTQAYGLKGNDTLISDNKSDVLLVGGSGDDSLIVMGGEATLSGGDGSDTFELNYSADKKLSAVIEDLQPLQDKIVVNFEGETAPQLSSVRSGSDVVWQDSDGLFKVTLKSVRDNDYFDDEASEEVWQVLELTNTEREIANETLEASASLSPLTMSQGLTAAASIRAKEITSKGKQGLLEDHKRLNGTDYFTVFKEVGKKYGYPGENLDGGARTPEDVVNDWITSKKGHREILLGAAFKKIGIGYNYDDPDPTDRRFYWTQEFADSLTSDSLGNPETVTAANLLRANISRDTVSKFIAGDDEPNTIENSDYGMTIDALGGNDSITNSGLNVSISGGADFDTILSSGSFGTINAGTGNDSISLSSDTKEVLIEYTAGDGSDTIVGFNATDTIKISDIEFTPEILGDDIILTVGDDSIKFLDLAKEEWAYKIGKNIDGYWTKLIIINESNYQHEYDMAGVTIQARSGNNTISNGLDGQYVSIECGAGDDSIRNNGPLVTINSGEGNDSIQNYGGIGASINTGAGNDAVSNALAVQVTIDSGEGSDTIENIYRCNNVSINAGSSNDSIGNGSANVTIVAGTGNDTIINWSDGTESKLLGNEGNDHINNHGASVSIDGGTGNDLINIFASEVTLDAGDDNDYINNEGNQVSIYGGNDKDTIISAGQLVTISGGKGNDRIELSSDAQNNVIEYNEGDGIDEVFGFNATDKLIIGGGTGTYYPVTVNGHPFIFVGTGFVALPNAGNLSVSDVVEGVIGEPIEGTGIIYLSESETDYTNTRNDVVIQVREGDYSARSIANSGSLVSIVPGASNNTISNSGDDVEILGSKQANNTISNTGDNVIIRGNLGSDSITNEGNNVRIYTAVFGQFSQNTINNSGNNVSINGSFNEDTITNSGDNVSILPWDGNDIIELTDDAQNNVIVHTPGEGYDVVYGFNETDTLLMMSGALPYSKRTVGNDIVVEFDDSFSSIALMGAATLESFKIRADWRWQNIARQGDTITFGDGDDSYLNQQASKTFYALGGDDTIGNTADNVTLDLGAGNDSVISQGNNGSIAGGDGDDYLVSTGRFNATIDSGDGNDEIHNFSSFNGSVSGGAGDDTIENFGNVVTIRGGAGNDSIKNSDATFREQGDNSLIDLGEGNNILWNYSNNVTITGGSGDNEIFNYGDSVKITTGDGDDTLYNSGDNISITTSGGNDSVFNSASNTTIDLGADNDFLHNRGANVSILMNDGDDTVKTDTDNVSINAGAGNDRITLESGVKDNLILYNVGDGDDTIWGLTKDNAKLQLGDGHVKYSTVASGDDIEVKVGNNTITLKDFREKPEHVIIGESGTSGGSGNSSGSGTSGSSGTGGTSSGQGGNTSGGTSASANSNSDASGGQSASGSAGTSASSGGNGSSGRGNSSSTTTAGSSITNPITIPETLSTTPTRRSSSANYNPLNTSVTTTQGTYSGIKMSPVERTYTGGNKIIQHYGSWRKITFEGEYKGAHFDGAGNFIVESSTGHLVFENATDKVINLKDAAGNDFIKAHMSSTAGTVDGRIYSGYQILNGSLGEDLIYAGADGSQLWGNADTASDTLVGGDGSDIFVGGKNEGSDTFQNASSADVVNLNDTSLSDIVSTNTRDGALVLSFNTGNQLTVQSTEALSANFIFSDGATRRFNHATNSWQTE